jgi:hypothetical protein
MVVCRVVAGGRQGERQEVAGVAGVGGKAVAGWRDWVGKPN